MPQKPIRAVAPRQLSLELEVDTEYREIPEHPYYRVGDDGSVWSRAYGDWRRLKACGKRYLHVNFLKSGKRYNFDVHVLVLTVFRGQCPEGMQACHGNGNSFDNRLENLRWDTSKANHYDREIHGTLPKGEKHGRSILTLDQVQEIRKSERRRGVATELAKRYDVALSTIQRILKGNTWINERQYLPSIICPVSPGPGNPDPADRGIEQRGTVGGRL